MSAAGARSGAVAAADPEVPGPGRRSWLALAAAILLLSAVGVVIYQWRASYQPLGYGSTGSSSEYYPGLPAGTGIRAVNTFGGVREDIYIPPQRGAFSLFVDLANNGTQAVIIESVTVPHGGPLTMAGPAVYTRPGGGDGQPAVPARHSVLRDVTLRPGQEIYVGLLVRNWPCGVEHSWVTVPAFLVTYRYLVFTRRVAVAWGGQDDELIMASPAGRPGQPGISCASR